MTPRNASPNTLLPAAGSNLPIFTLCDTAGVARRLWDYKQRHPVLLTVLGDTHDPLSRAWLARLLAERRRLDEYGTALLVVAPEPVERLRELQVALDLPFILLADPDGAVAAGYLPPASAHGARMAIYLADRYLQCLDRWLIGEDGDLPAVDELAAALALADQDDCACGLPASYAAARRALALASPHAQRGETLARPRMRYMTEACDTCLRCSNNEGAGNDAVGWQSSGHHRRGVGIRARDGAAIRRGGSVCRCRRCE